MVDRHSLRKCDDAAFSRTVRGTRRLDEIAIHRGHVDDAPFRLSQVWQKELRAQEHSSKINTNFLVPFLECRVFDRLVNLNRSVVKQGIDLGKGSDRLCNQVLN